MQPISSAGRHGSSAQRPGPKLFGQEKGELGLLCLVEEALVPTVQTVLPGEIHLAWSGAGSRETQTVYLVD